MKRCEFLLVLLVIGLSARPAIADPIYLAGAFGGSLPGDPTPLREGSVNTVVETDAGQITNQWLQQHARDSSSNICCGEHGIAVDTTIRTIGLPGEDNKATQYFGAQYTLDGHYTGTTYTNPLGGRAQVYDGTTDTLHNYIVNTSDSTIYQTDVDFTNPLALFSETGASGISFDPLNNSLWISDEFGIISDHRLDGTLLSSFIATGMSASPCSTCTHFSGLAFNPSDGTLWMTDAAPTAFYLRQYAVDGTALASVAVTSYGFPSAEDLPPSINHLDEVSGAEFVEVAYMPEGSTWLLSLMGIGALLVSSRFGDGSPAHGAAQRSGTG